MTVTAKPKPAKDLDVNKLINKGGSVAQQSDNNDEVQQPEQQQVLFRMPTDMLEQVDRLAKRRRPVKLTRRAWLIEAVSEKLKRELKDS